MPFFATVQTIAAGASVDLLNVTVGITRPWKYNRAPYSGILEVMVRAAAVGCTLQITAGSDEVEQESPISAGGTAGVLPARLATEPITFTVQQGDVISVVATNTTGAGVEVQATFELTRAKG
jgi:hypothetical protein